MRILIKFSITVLFLIIVQSNIGQAQCGNSPNTFPVVSQKTHDEVLDILFPRDSPKPSDYDFFFVMRFQPSFADESQIVVRKFKNVVEVTQYKSLSGNIYVGLNKILAKTCRENAEEMAEQFKVEKKAITFSRAKIEQWHNGLLLSLSRSFGVFGQRVRQLDKDDSVKIALDGTNYQLWYMQNGDEISLELYDAEINDSRDKGIFPVVRLMNNIRRQIQK